MEVLFRQSNGRVFRLVQDSILVFGRSSECSISALADDTTVSRHHFLLEASPPSLWIRDLGSLNGTMVDGVKLGGKGGNRMVMRLKGGETVVAGSTQFQVERPLLWGLPVQCRACGLEVRQEAGSGLGAPEIPRLYVCDTCRKQDRLKALGLDPRAPVLGVKLEQRIGGIGECWEGKLDKKPVRVFLLAPESPLTASALEELVGRLQVLVGLQGEGLSELLAAGSVGRGLGLVYEAKGAGDLEERLERSKSSWDQVRPLLLSALMGLKILHERGLVHRELSPDRIRLDRGGRPFIEGGGLATMLVGFSGSRIAARPIRAPWMAPEQLLEGEVVRPSSDIWSLVACCSKALTGHPPRMCKAGTDPLAGVLEGEFIPLRKRLPELPRGVGAALDRALALDPGRRFPDATEFLAELSRLE